MGIPINRMTAVFERPYTVYSTVLTPMCLFQVHLGVRLGPVFFGELGEPFGIGDKGYAERGCGRLAY